MLVQVLLEADEDLPDVFRLSQICQGIGDGIMVSEAEQRGQFFLIQLLHADADVVREHEIKESLLFTVEMRADGNPCSVGTLLAMEWRERIGHVRKYVKEVALLGADDFLHLG